MNKVIATLVLLIVFPLSCGAGALSLPAPEFSLVFEVDDLGEHLPAPGYTTVGSPGDPALPFKELNVILPPDADLSSVRVMLTGATISQLPEKHAIAPAPPMVTVVDGQEVYDWGEGKLIESGRNMLVYSKDEFYPAANVELAEVGSMRNWRIARIRYYPCRFNPVAGRLELAEGGQIVVSYNLNASVAAASQYSRDNVLSDSLARFAVNYPEARAWYEPATSVSVQGIGTAASGSTDYVILTTSAIVSGSAKLQAFAAHKTNRGFNVAVVTQTQWGGGQGDAAAEKIRAYLKANYLSKGIRYVLFIGNPSPSTGDVPMKMLWPRYGSTTYREAPSDYYYADLTGNWDLDRDGNYGEQDHDFGPGGIDRFPEVIVGRIPFYGSFSDLDSILQKIMDYESGAIGGDWVRNVLMSAKPSDAQTPGYHLFEAIKSVVSGQPGFTTTRVYEETYGLNPPPDYTPCTYDTVLTAWQRHAGFHFWWTHGNETLAADIMTSTRTQYLDDRYPLFTFQNSCLNAYPELAGNLAYSLLKKGAIATVAATRVSWYYPGETNFTNTDSNAGMCYRYAAELIGERLPCGDALFQMMVQVPNYIWMNHCVFTVYGDPSVSYASGPVITHTPLTDTDVTAFPYRVIADVTSNGPLKAGNPVLLWNTNGGATFNSIPMSLVTGATYAGDIPPQPNGTTVYYYIRAEDAAGRVGISPTGAPSSPNSFRVRPDTVPPVFQHTPLTNTGDIVGPYTVTATVTDDTGLSSVTLLYNKNSGSDVALPMLPKGANVFEASIPGPTSAGDVIGYAIVAVDSTTLHNTSRLPSSTGYYSFAISNKRLVAILNSTSSPSYFYGSNSNAYQTVADVLNADPKQRFQVTIITGLTSTNLSGKDALVLPDNGVAPADFQSVSSWFQPGRTILTLDTSVCYASFSGFLWPAAAGLTGYGTYWDYNAGSNDQVILAQDPITSGYTLGQVIESRGYHAQFAVDKLPSDAIVLAGKSGYPNSAYAVYRDVPGRGRIVALGPYIPVQQTQHSMIREALVAYGSSRGIQVIAPAGGEVYRAGSNVRVEFQTSGTWGASDRIKLEYSDGTSPQWRSIPGAEALPGASGAFYWNTSGLVGSHNYKLRASMVGGSTSDETNAAFTIFVGMNIPEAKYAADGEVVELATKLVSCHVPGFCFIQEPDRQSGIRINCSYPLSVGSIVTVMGAMSTLLGERELNVETVQLLSGSPTLRSIALNTRALGGGAFGLQQPVMEYRMVKQGTTWSKQLLPVAGLNNIGLLVRVFGNVTAVGTDYFYMDDGGGCDDGSGNKGVRVICGSLAKPTLGSRVVLDAVSCAYLDRGSLFRSLVLPGQSSLQIVQ